MCIHLLSTINAEYEVPFRVTVQSLLNQLEADIPVTWHVFGTGLATTTREAIETQATEHSMRFRWYDFSPDQFADLPVRGRFIPHVYARIIAPGYLPDDVDHFLYLDGDLLFLDGISALWKTDLQDKVIAAAPDMAVPRASLPMGIARYRELGIAADDPYFNAGVYLVDRAAWERHDTSQRALDYIQRYGDSINLLDQDALNVALHGCWKPLNIRWNLISSLAGRRHYRLDGIDSAEYQRALTDPGIIHFAGLLKPWKYPRTASLWTPQYLETLHQVFPLHQFSNTLEARSYSFYDHWLRRFLYPAENYVWGKRKGF